MRAKIIGYALLSTATFLALVVAFSDYAVSVNLPGWWISTFGYDYASTMVWWQLVHTIALLVLALPVAFAIVRVSGDYAVKIGIASSVFIAIVAVVHVTWSWHLFVNSEILAGNPWRVVSTVYDVLKYPTVFLFSVWAIRRVAPTKNALH